MTGIPREGRSCSRPIRVAFLVQDGEHADLALDGVFAESYRRWGGRFSLVVPCSENRIQSSYWPWLITFDPDVVYSFVPLQRSDVLDLHERINPSIYKLHEHRGELRLDVFGFTPHYGAEPLSSLSTIFRLARYRHSDIEDGGLSIIDSWHTEKPSRFLTDNFGTYRTSYGTGIYPPDAQQAARLLTIVSPDKANDRKFGVPRNLTMIPDEQAAFQAFAERRATSLSMASICFAPKMDIRRHQWSESFNLVVGDTFADRVLFWNVRLLIRNWLGNDICCLRISRDQIDDEDFLIALVAFLNRPNHVNQGGGQPILAIRSTSLRAEELEQIAEKIRKARCWSAAITHFVANDEEMLPSKAELEHASPGHRLGPGLHLSSGWTEFVWNPPIFRPPANTPNHLSDAPSRQHFTTGAWATDYILENGDPKPRFSNTNYWQLPRRWRVAGAFTATFPATNQELRIPARGTQRGYLTLFEQLDRPVQGITVPTASEAICHALSRDGQEANLAGYQGPIVPDRRVAHMSPSNEARYLNGVLGMAGSLQQARGFLLHPFMREVLSFMGGTPNLPIDKVDPTVSRLRKLRPKIPAFDLADSNERQVLGTLIVKAAQTLKTPRSFVKYEEIARRWTAWREAYWQGEHPKPDGDPSVDWEAHERQSLDDCLIDMRGRQMLFQGHQWTCPECHHRNWVDLSELRSRLCCTICRHETDAPIAIEWLFRPNEFLIEGLRDHSVLSLIWVLTAVSDQTRESFFYTGPSLFYFENSDDGPNAEADLLMVSDGRAIVCEAKSSWTRLRSQDIDDLVSLARRLKPDVALLAVMDTGERQKEKIAEKIAQARRDLSEVGIKLELMTLSTHPLEDDPYLR